MLQSYKRGDRVKIIGYNSSGDSEETKEHVQREVFLLQGEDESTRPDYALTPTGRKAGFVSFENLIACEEELIINNKEVHMKNASPMAKKFLDADTIALIEAGYLSSTLELTDEGIRARDEIVFDSAQKELIKLAKEKIAKAKKCEADCE